MKLILALALGATAQFATPALRGGARRPEAPSSSEQKNRSGSRAEAARATALAEAMAQLKRPRT